ncbi:MAG: T9SS type A sorting domain-containing protein [Bacteroidetes bacterium]|nr:T9SS type A sorting domain-containing protein [Bacteroidota bacterium]
MIKRILFLGLLSLSLNAQHKHDHHHFDGKHSAAKMLDYRLDNWQGTETLELAKSLLGTFDWQLVEYKNLNSPGGNHIHYYLYLDGRKLDFQGLSIHQYNNGKLWIQYPELPNQVASFSPLEVDTTGLKVELNCNRMLSEAAFLSVDDQLLPGFSLNFFGAEGAHYQSFVAGNEIFNLADNRRYANDTTCDGYVFLPDPLTTNNVNYGGNYIDNNDADNASLTASRYLQSFRGTYDNGLFKLENNDIKIDDFSMPNVAPVTSTTGTFNYTRGQDGFEDVNAFFHMSEFKTYIDSLGFSAIPGAQVSVDVHALSNADQSYYTPSEQKIYMGEGGVDDAEDADVVIHEFGHSLVSGAAANTNRISERAGMEEAICDYFAITWSLHFSGNQRGRVFNWDGHNAFWNGRSAVSTKDYQTLSFNSNIYAHTDLMASCLLEIRDNTNRQVADRVILEALFTLQNNSTYADFARMVINADDVLYSGANFQVIKAAFVRRNVLPADFSINESSQIAGINLYNSLGFLKGEALLIESENSDLASYSLRDAQGKEIEEGQLEGRKDKLSINVSSGIYFLSVRNENGQSAYFKLLK